MLPRDPMREIQAEQRSTYALLALLASALDADASELLAAWRSALARGDAEGLLMCAEDADALLEERSDDAA